LCYNQEPNTFIMQRKNSIKEKQDQHNKSDWGGPQQDNQTQKEILTGSNTSLNENVNTNEDHEVNEASDLDEIKEENLFEADLDQKDRKGRRGNG
jgi:hypothetical protein